ncbi:MAG: HD domain-containing protein [Planctomycetota bacterium]|nr:HD domain-containing protein [Planctomycetota bacterium]
MPTQAASIQSPNSTAELIEVDQLVLGRKIGFPIHDGSGVLLLAAGSTITSEFKRLLRVRSIQHVLIHPADRPQQVQEELALQHASYQRLGNAATRELDEAVDSGLLFVNNLGQPLQQDRRLHGTNGFDPQLRDEIRSEQIDAIRIVAGLMKQVVSGKRIEAQGLLEITDAFIRHLLDDMDLVISLWIDGNFDRGLPGHCLQMSLLSMAIGIEMGLNKQNVQRVGVAGLVHDWGMCKVPEHIRSAPRKLTWRERFEIMKHPIHTVRLLERVWDLPNTVMLSAYQVHEKLDGTGYPRGRSKGSIFLFSRILHVADEYVALTSQRPYRDALSQYEAISQMLNQEEHRAADPIVLRSLLRVISLFPVGSHVTLSDHRVARVLRSNGDNYTTPVVEIVTDAEGKSTGESGQQIVIDLAGSLLRIDSAVSPHQPAAPYFHLRQTRAEPELVAARMMIGE